MQTGTEHADVCPRFLRHLVERGLRVADGLLVVIDGSEGLRRAVRDVWGDQAQVQRCTWHKRENVVTYLPKPLQPAWRAKLQQAYRQPTYAAAHVSLHRLHGELRRLNEDAAKSLAEGLEETLTLHRLGLADRLGTSLYPSYSHIQKIVASGSVPLLKLHGSVSWSYRGGRLVRYHDCRPAIRGDAAIVAPITEKTVPSYLQPTWEVAERALSPSRHVADSRLQPSNL